MIAELIAGAVDEAERRRTRAAAIRRLGARRVASAPPAAVPRAPRYSLYARIAVVTSPEPITVIPFAVTR